MCARLDLAEGPAGFAVEEGATPRVAQPSRECAQMIHIGLAREEESIGTRFAALRVAEPIVGFHTDHDTPRLHVVAGLTAGEIAAELRLHLRAERNVPPVLIPPRPAGVKTDVGASPIAGPVVYRGGNAVLDAAGRTWSELVAQARVDAPTIDVLTDAIIKAGIAQPTGVGERGGGAETELAVGADPIGAQRGLDLGWTTWAKHQCLKASCESRGHVAGK